MCTSTLLEADSQTALQPCFQLPQVALQPQLEVPSTNQPQLTYITVPLPYYHSPYSQPSQLHGPLYGLAGHGQYATGYFQPQQLSTFQPPNPTSTSSPTNVNDRSPFGVQQSDQGNPQPQSTRYAAQQLYHQTQQCNGQDLQGYMGTSWTADTHFATPLGQSGASAYDSLEDMYNIYDIPSARRVPVGVNDVNGHGFSDCYFDSQGAPTSQASCEIQQPYARYLQGF